MILRLDSLTKKAYCNTCFSILQFDSPDDELTVFGNRVIICPICGKLINIDKAVIIPGEEQEPVHPD